MGGDEVEKYPDESEGDTERRKLIVDILLTWFNSAPLESLDVLESIKVCTVIQRLF